MLDCEGRICCLSRSPKTSARLLPNMHFDKLESFFTAQQLLGSRVELEGDHGVRRQQVPVVLEGPYGYLVKMLNL